MKNLSKHRKLTFLKITFQPVTQAEGKMGILLLSACATGKNLKGGKVDKDKRLPKNNKSKHFQI